MTDPKIYSYPGSNARYLHPSWYPRTHSLAPQEECSNTGYKINHCTRSSDSTSQILNRDNFESTILSDPISSLPLTQPQCITSEGRGYKLPVKVPPLSDKEFNKLLESIPKQKSLKIEPQLNKTTNTRNQQLLQHPQMVQSTKQSTRRTKRANLIAMAKGYSKMPAYQIFYVKGQRESLDTLLQGPNEQFGREL